MSTKTVVVHSDPKILGGTPVFVGTRVPVQVLFDCLEAGDPLERFLDQYPNVSREQALAALEIARDALISMDKNMSTEDDISRYRIGLVLVRAFSNRIEALQPARP